MEAEENPSSGPEIPPENNALVALVEKYFEKDPAAAARILETLDDDTVVEALKRLPSSISAQAVRQLPDGFVASLLQKLPYPLFREIVDQLEPHRGASIFLHFPDHLRHLFLVQMSEKRKQELQELLTYPEDSAGRIMSTQFMAFHADLKVRDAIQKIRQLARQGTTTSYVYVVDPDNRLIGVLNMRDMLLASEDATLQKVMRQEIFMIPSFMDREKVAAELSARSFFAAPVVDAQNRLLGVIRADELIDSAQEEATEDLQKMFGAGGDERVSSPLSFSLRMRLPWLYVNLATAFLAASVVALFEDIIARITVLAIFLPVVAGQGGNAGAQSLAVVMRGLVMREIVPNRAGRLILKETAAGLINGIAVGVVTAGIAWVWQGNGYLGLVIGLAMVTTLMIAGFSGAAIPMLMKAIGLDPAQCSNIILTTITDVLGFFSFLGFAVLFQKHLV